MAIIKADAVQSSNEQERQGDEIPKEKAKKGKDGKGRLKRLSKEGNFNCGRWQPEEHQKFIEAIMKYGNEWKMVQKHVGSRSSTQARSHAQKFFVKMKSLTNLTEFDVDLSGNSIQNLHNFANSLSIEEFKKIVHTLNSVAFEKKGFHQKKPNLETKNRKKGFNSKNYNSKYVFLKIFFFFEFF